jgi:hypothetical protein
MVKIMSQTPVTCTNSPFIPNNPLNQAQYCVGFIGERTEAQKAYVS